MPVLLGGQGDLAAEVMGAGLVDEGVTVALGGKMRLRKTIKMHMRMLKRCFLLKENPRLLSNGVAARVLNIDRSMQGARGLEAVKVPNNAMQNMNRSMQDVNIEAEKKKGDKKGVKGEEKKGDNKRSTYKHIPRSKKDSGMNKLRGERVEKKGTLDDVDDMEVDLVKKARVVHDGEFVNVFVVQEAGLADQPHKVQ